MDPSLRTDLMEAVDDTWAELIRHLPLSDGEPDGDRQVMSFTAVLRTGERAVERSRFGRSEAAPPGVAADGGVLRIDRGVHADLLIRKGDKVVALERNGEPVFEVQHVNDRSHLRLICYLGDA